MKKKHAKDKFRLFSRQSTQKVDDYTAKSDVVFKKLNIAWSIQAVEREIKMEIGLVRNRWEMASKRDRMNVDTCSRSQSLVGDNEKSVVWGWFPASSTHWLISSSFLSWLLFFSSNIACIPKNDEIPRRCIEVDCLWSR